MPTELPTCCTPRQYHAPSGLAWFHERACPVGRGQKIRRVHDPVPGGISVHTDGVMEEVRTGDGVLRFKRRVRGSVHPACKAARDSGYGTPCPACSWRMGLDNDGAAAVQAALDAEH